MLVGRLWIAIKVQIPTGSAQRLSIGQVDALKNAVLEVDEGDERP